MKNTDFNTSGYEYNISNIFSQRLREARIKAEMSQAELSRHTGITPSTLSSYEVKDNPKKPTMEKVVLIAKALNVSLDWLCGITDIQQIELQTVTPEINSEMLLRVITDLAVNQPYRTISVKMLAEYVRPKDREHMPPGCQFAAPTIAGGRVGSFYRNLLQLIELKKNDTIAPDLFDICVEQLILKTVNQIEEDEKKMSESNHSS